MTVSRFSQKKPKFVGQHFWAAPQMLTYQLQWDGERTRRESDKTHGLRQRQCCKW